ncbi:MAG: DNA ligase [Rubrivivax sp.]|nr:DNA ligase [Rubrivivax sp.]
MPQIENPSRRPFLRQVLKATSAAALTCVGTPWGGALAAAREAPPLQLAREAPPDIDPTGYLVSEKLDGVRAWWDGTRLRFRSGLPVLAPHWFTSSLPAAPLDGELWLGRGRFEDLAGAVRRSAAVDGAWRQVKYVVFDLRGAGGPFEQRSASLSRLVAGAGFPQLMAAPQCRLADRAELRRWFDEVVREGGEGLMLHRADAAWRTGRSDALLKLKPLADAEAVVVGHVPGRGRHEGRLGALQVRTAEGVEFLLGTGLTDRQRAQPPETGATIVFTYRGRTASGVPRFASFLRARDPLRS